MTAFRLASTWSRASFGAENASRSAVSLAGVVVTPENVPAQYRLVGSDTAIVFAAGAIRSTTQIRDVIGRLNDK